MDLPPESRSTSCLPPPPFPSWEEARRGGWWGWRWWWWMIKMVVMWRMAWEEGAVKRRGFFLGWRRVNERIRLGQTTSWNMAVSQIYLIFELKYFIKRGNWLGEFKNGFRLSKQKLTEKDLTNDLHIDMLALYQLSYLAYSWSPDFVKVFIRGVKRIYLARLIVSPKHSIYSVDKFQIN